jgi:hypothetical protein
MPCDSLLTCVGGWIPTQYPYYFEGQFTLPSPCPEWKVVYESGQRDSLLNASGNSLYIETRVFDPCTYSPWVSSFYSLGILNQPFSVDLGVTSLEPDSLVYSLSTPKTTEDTNIIFNSGFSTSQPIPGLTFNSSTGKFNFIPTQVGEYVIGITIEAYNQNTGNLSSITLIDYTVWIIDSLNIEPKLSNIQNLQGNAILTNPTTISTQLGDSFSFEIIATDSDLGDSITFWSDIKSVLPGATVTKLNGNPGELLVSWKVPSSPNETKKLELFVMDDFCFPSVGSKEFTIIIGTGINSINKTPKDLGITIYPNPVQETLHIDLGKNPSVTVEIISLRGEVLLKKRYTSNNFDIDLSNYSTGFYLVKFTTKKGIEFKRIVKN